MTGTLDTLTPNQQLEAVYVGYYSRAADAGGFSYWESEYASLVAGGKSDSQALTQIANEFGPPQAETLTEYPQFLNLTPPFNAALTSDVVGVTSFVNAVYENVFNRPLANGDTYWVDQILANKVTLGEAILFIENGAIGNDATTLLNKIAVASAFTADTGAVSLGFGGRSNYPTDFLATAHNLVLNTTDAASGPGSVGFQESYIQPDIANWLSSANTFTLTIGQDTFVGTTGHDTFNAPLVSPAGGQLTAQPTLTNYDSLTDGFFQGTAYSVLNASFNGADDVSGLNIVNIPIWNIVNNDKGFHTVSLAGDGVSGPSNIDGLNVLNYDAHSGGDSLLIGNNSEPIETGNNHRADGFQINVSNAVGNGQNGVDVDIAARDFQVGDTIKVTAKSVGGFPLDSGGSYVVPDPILGTTGDPDSYNPNWEDYSERAFAIAAGASAGPSGPVGFTNWVVSSTGATAIGSLNVIALGGEGSTSATSLTLTDDGSNTMLFATAISDSLLSDWKNLTTIDLTGTSGFVTLTGAEATAAIGGASYFLSQGAGGLLTDVGLSGTASYTSGLTIMGGSGNSFYDLSSMTLTAAHLSSIDGGHGTTTTLQPPVLNPAPLPGNSEVAFNNSVIANASSSNYAGTTVAISNIQILDDTGTVGNLQPTGFSNPIASGVSTQGGDINMADFAGLQALNQNYALISQDNALSATGQTVVPYGLPFTSTTSALVESGAAAAVAGQSNDVIQAGYQVLQLLNNEGSTAATQTSDLFIYNGPTQFAINAEDVANGWFSLLQPIQPTQPVTDGSTHPIYTTPFYLDGYNLTIQGEYVGPSVNTTDTLRYYVSDDGVTVHPTITPGSSMGGTNSFTASDTPVVQILNYTNVDFFLPYESLQPSHGSGNASSKADPGSIYANWVILGSTSFTDTPVVLSYANGAFQNATLNFYDNTTDTGGSDPGGPSDLALGKTNLVINPGQSALGIDSIGVDTVQVDANAITTTISDFGKGLFEIGATDATTINAASTSHLIQDISATLDYFTANNLTAPQGITVTGSATGQNLEQGTSGMVFADHGFGDHGTLIFTDLPSTLGFNSAWDGPFQGKGTFAGVDTHIGNDVTAGGVGNTLIAEIQHGGPNGGWGNDILTGGDGANGVTFQETGGLLGKGITYTGNSGDNFFPEGGNDVVNFGARTNPLTAHDGTVWFGMYNVSNSGDHLGILQNSGVGVTYGQAITDINSAGQEVYVDGYGPGTAHGGGVTGSTTSSLQINHFDVGNTAKTGDIINLNVNDWATGHLNGSTSNSHDLALGLTNGALNSLAALGTHNADAVTQLVGGTQSEEVNHNTTLILDSNASYANASQLVTGLTGNGAINFGDLFGGATLAAGSVAHVLIAYGNTSSGVTIDDLTLTNTTNHTLGSSISGLNTNTTGLAVSAVDDITVTGVSLAQLHDHNFHFV